MVQRRVPVGSAASALETCISNRPTTAVPKPPATGRVSAKSVGADAAIAGLYMSAKARLSKRLRIVVAAAPVATIISDPRLPENPIIAVNQAFLDLTGYGPDEVLDRNCRFLSGLGTEPWLTERIREGVRDHHPVLVEILNYKKGGVPFRNAVLVAPIYDEDDELLYFLGAQIEIVGCAQSISENRRERAVQCLSQLTPRQLEVTKLVAQGLLNKQIAGLLGLSIKTVKMHRGLVMTRLELRNQADLIRLAVEAGL
jgi:PAS domain S-box-containing protein